MRAKNIKRRNPSTIELPAQTVMAVRLIAALKGVREEDILHEALVEFQQRHHPETIKA